jgi:hypothetical protein
VKDVLKRYDPIKNGEEFKKNNTKNKWIILFVGRDAYVKVFPFISYVFIFKQNVIFSDYTFSDYQFKPLKVKNSHAISEHKFAKKWRDELWNQESDIVLYNGKYFGNLKDMSDYLEKNFMKEAKETKKI